MKKIALLLATFLMISTVSAFSFGDFLNFQDDTGEVALINLEGPITPTAGGFSAGMTPGEVRELNQRAEERDVDAIVYEINSGGGAVVASKDVQRSIEDVDVPTVCRIRDVGASGAYLFSLGCDSIVADSASITGSIGVSSSYLEFSDLMEDVGVNHVNITVGDRKEIGSPYKEPDEEDVEVLEGKAQIIGDDFLGEVSEARNLSDQQTERVGTGEIFLGSEARDLELVDSLGGRQQAIEEAEQMTDKRLNPVRVDVTPEFDFLSLLLPGIEVNLFGEDSPLQAEI